MPDVSRERIKRVAPVSDRRAHRCARKTARIHPWQLHSGTDTPGGSVGLKNDALHRQNSNVGTIGGGFGTTPYIVFEVNSDILIRHTPAFVFNYN